MSPFLRIFFVFCLVLCGFFAKASNGLPAVADPIVRLYPNPATSVVNLELKDAQQKGYSLQIFSFLGRKMHELVNVPVKTIINLSDYNRGVYIYQLRDKSGKLVETGKFQVSK